MLSIEKTNQHLGLLLTAIVLTVHCAGKSNAAIPQQPTASLPPLLLPPLQPPLSSPSYLLRGSNNRPPVSSMRNFGSCRDRGLCCSGRDSSCMITTLPGFKSYNSQPDSTSLIGNLIAAGDQSPKECYCDSACITLGDCCPDYKETCGVRDCIVSDWDQWSECNVTCGLGSMTRTRKILAKEQNGGNECSELKQQRACHGQQCQIKDDEKMLREMAIILQSSLSTKRHINQTQDIRRNLRLNYPKDPLKENVNEYCVLFEITKSRKNCESLGREVNEKLIEGTKVCVHCQEAAMRRHLGYRCYGHGTDHRPTKWSMLNFGSCQGRWTRLDEQLAIGGLCQCNVNVTDVRSNVLTTIKQNPDFIFV